MATFGTFTKSGEAFTGEIITLAVQAKEVHIIPAGRRASDNAPSHRMFVGQSEIEAGWTKISQGGREYLALKLEWIPGLGRLAVGRKVPETWGPLVESSIMLDATQLWLPTLAYEPAGRLPRTPRVRTARPRVRVAGAATQVEPDLRASRWAYLGVVARWSLTGAEALTLMGEPLSDDGERHERLQGIQGAHRSLLLLAPDPARYARLLRESALALDGGSMLQVMMVQGLPGIGRVRAHLLALLGR